MKYCHNHQSSFSSSILSVFTLFISFLYFCVFSLVSNRFPIQMIKQPPQPDILQHKTLMCSLKNHEWTSCSVMIFSSLSSLRFTGIKLELLLPLLYESMRQWPESVKDRHRVHSHGHHDHDVSTLKTLVSVLSSRQTKRCFSWVNEIFEALQKSKS